MKRKLSAAVIFTSAAMLGFASSAGAVDGTIEINQAKVLAAGGFPFVISTADTSYRLTSSLIVSSAAADAIDVNASHDTIDLNGFPFTGPGGNTSTSDGINGSAAGALTVENGTVTGFLVDIYTGNYGIVRNVHATASHVGIKAGTGNVISGSTADGNGTAGIYCVGSGCAISPMDAIHLLDDFHSAGRISGAKRIPLAHPIFGQSNRRATAATPSDSRRVCLSLSA